MPGIDSLMRVNLSPIAITSLVLSTALPARGGAQTQSSFYPVSVWYSGGKARAPMLELVNGKVPAQSARIFCIDY
jgi:hypothetical protein